MNINQLPLLEDLLQALKYDDDLLTQDLVATLRGDASVQEVARSLLQNVSALSGNRGDSNSILELAGRLCDSPSTVGHATLPSQASCSFSRDLSRDQLSPGNYHTEQSARCDEHAHVEEWIACPECKTCFKALNDFATCWTLDDPACCAKNPNLQDEHMMIIGIDQGWDRVRKMKRFDGSWDRQARFDEKLKLQCIMRPVERMAFFFVRYLYHYKTLPFDYQVTGNVASFSAAYTLATEHRTR